IRNKDFVTTAERDSLWTDFYSDYDKYAVDKIDQQELDKQYNSLSKEEREVYDSEQNFYELTFTNKGGLVMPLILQFKYEDGTEEIVRIPAEIWKLNANEISKVFMREKRISTIVLDPYQE